MCKNTHMHTCQGLHTHKHIHAHTCTRTTPRTSTGARTHTLIRQGLCGLHSVCTLLPWHHNILTYGAWQGLVWSLMGAKTCWQQWLFRTVQQVVTSDVWPVNLWLCGQCKYVAFHIYLPPYLTRLVTQTSVHMSGEMEYLGVVAMIKAWADQCFPAQLMNMFCITLCQISQHASCVNYKFDINYMLCVNNKCEVSIWACSFNL